MSRLSAAEEYLSAVQRLTARVEEAEQERDYQVEHAKKLVTRIRELEEALREIASMAGSAGSGEVQAMPIAKRVRAVLEAKEGEE